MLYTEVLVSGEHFRLVVSTVATQQDVFCVRQSRVFCMGVFVSVCSQANRRNGIVILVLSH